jgi:hypothetical protein
MTRKLQVVVTVVALLVGFGALGGCGEDALAPKKSGDGAKSPSEVAMLYLDGFRGDVAAVRAYNPGSSMTEEYLQSLGEDAAGGFATGLGVTFTDAQLAEIGEAYTDALGRVEAAVVDEQVDGDRATVTLEVRSVDVSSSLEEVAAELLPPDVGQEAATYTEFLVEGLAGAEPLEEPVSYEMSLDRGGDGRWSPDAASGKGLVQALVRWS